MMKYLNGDRLEITNVVDDNFEYIDCEANVCYLPQEYFADTLEESLKKWKPTLIQDINKYHIAKFGNQPELTQVKKLYEEVVELFKELEHYFDNPDNIDKIKDEYGDVIQAGSGLFNVNQVIYDNFQKLAERKYPDGFKHKD